LILRNEVIERWENCVMRSFVMCILLLILFVDQIKEDEMGRMYNMFEGDEKCIQNFSLKNINGSDSWEILVLMGER
jgi:hypothetical protein